MVKPATVAEEALEPTLAEANEELRTILAAGWLMDGWGVVRIKDALDVATARVRVARRRQGYDDPD